MTYLQSECSYKARIIRRRRRRFNVGRGIVLKNPRARRRQERDAVSLDGAGAPLHRALSLHRAMRLLLATS